MWTASDSVLIGIPLAIAAYVWIRTMMTGASGTDDAGIHDVTIIDVAIVLSCIAVFVR